MNLRETLTGTGPTDPLAQNLIDNHSVAISGPVPGYHRAIWLDIVAVLTAALFGFSYYRYLTQGLLVWFLLAALTLFGVVSVIEALLSKTTERGLGIIFLETLVVLAFFWKDNIEILGIIAGIMLIMVSWGYLSGRARLHNGIEIPFFGVSEEVLGKFTTGLLLFMILAYVPQIGGNALIVSSQSFRTFFDWTSGFVNGFYPELSLNGSFGDFAQSVSQMELNNNPNFQALNSTQQSIALQQATTQFTQTFLQSAASGTVATSSPTSDAFYNVLNGVLNAWQSQSSGWFDVGWVTVLFIGLRALGILFVWFAQFISLIVYELLLAAGFMKISEETHPQEVLGY